MSLVVQVREHRRMVRACCRRIVALQGQEDPGRSIMGCSTKASQTLWTGHEEYAISNCCNHTALLHTEFVLKLGRGGSRKSPKGKHQLELQRPIISHAECSGYSKCFLGRYSCLTGLLFTLILRIAKVHDRRRNHSFSNYSVFAAREILKDISQHKQQLPSVGQGEFSYTKRSLGLQSTSLHGRSLIFALPHHHSTRCPPDCETSSKRRSR